MVAADESDSIGIADLEGQQEEEGLDGVVAPIDKVTEELFGGGLMGKMAGGLFKSAFNTLSEAAAEATKGVKKAYDEAAFAVESSDAVRDALGTPVQVRASTLRPPLPHPHPLPFPPSPPACAGTADADADLLNAAAVLAAHAAELELV